MIMKLQQDLRSSFFYSGDTYNSFRDVSGWNISSGIFWILFPSKNLRQRREVNLSNLCDLI